MGHQPGLSKIRTQKISFHGLVPGDVRHRNEILVERGEDPIAFDSDCREGICGTCSLVINGPSHGPATGTTCRFYMRRFSRTKTPSGSSHSAPPHSRQSGIWWWTAAPSMRSSKPAATSWSEPSPHLKRTRCRCRSMFGSQRWKPPPALCAALVWRLAQIPLRCLLVGTKVSHLGLLPQGQAERESRVIHMVRKMDELGFGNCSNHYECEAICPAEVSATFMARLYREYAIAAAKEALAV